jgi:hypothetical protein
MTSDSKAVGPGTALPWSPERYIGRDDSWFIRGARVNGRQASICGRGSASLTEQDAAYIVRACNSFPEMVAALEEAIELLVHLGAHDEPNTILAQARAAYAKARGEA